MPTARRPPPAADGHSGPIRVSEIALAPVVLSDSSILHLLLNALDIDSQAEAQRLHALHR